MPDSGAIAQPILLDGVAGLELAKLEAWAVDWFQQYGSSVFKTVERWRGQMREEGGIRRSFTTPALFISCVGNRGASTTRGGMLSLDVEFAGVIVCQSTGLANLGDKKDRYDAAIASASAMLRMLHVMDPQLRTDEQIEANAPRKLWSRPDQIQFQNVYSESADKKGFSMFEFRWVHTMQVGDINVNCLEDLNEIFGQIFPNDPTKSNPPVEGEVDFTP